MVGTGLPAQQPRARIRKVVREDAAAGRERDDAERMEKLDRENPYFKNIAGLGAFDEYRPGQRMRTGAALGHVQLDSLQRVRNLRLPRPAHSQPLQTTRDHRLDADALTRGHAQHRRHA